MLCVAKLPFLFSFLSSLFTGKSRGRKRREEKREERREKSEEYKKKKPLTRLFLFGTPGGIRFSPAGSVRARGNDPPDRFLTRARFESPIIRKRKTPRKGSFPFGTPGGIRTPDLLVRSQALYPAELQAHAAQRRIYYHFPHLLSTLFSGRLGASAGYTNPVSKTDEKKLDKPETQ